MLRTRVRAGPVAGVILSLVAAVVLTAIQAGDLYVRSWALQVGEPARVTVRVPYGPRLVRNVTTGRADLEFVHEQTVVWRGQIVNSDDQVHRAALAYEASRRDPHWRRVAGMGVIFFTLSMALTAYMRKFGQNRLRLLRSQIGLFVAIGLMALGAKALLILTPVSELWVPVAVVPLWVAAAFDRRTAFLVAMICAFIVASLQRFDLMLLGVMLTVGLAATLMVLDRKRTRHLVSAGVFAGMSGAALLVALLIAIEGRFDVVADLSRLTESGLLATLGGGAAAGVLAATLRGPAERLLGNVPRDRLLDLTDLEHPLLQKMAREAPGSWEHSRAMANLAEQAASAIGADALLTRVGAYYHDLGKTIQAKYFVENLGADEVSPHESLEPEVSADAIMAHVVVGTRILREGGVPEPVVEFAYTHHGTQVVEFFWNKCLQQGNPKDLTEANFRYPGMKPQTKETAILMLVDSIEAASRTISPPERDAFEMMIQRVLFTKLKSGQLDDSGLEVKDLRVLATRMADTLVNMNHHRVKYQWQVQRAEEFGVPSQAVSLRPSAPEIEVRAQSTQPPPLDTNPPAPTLRTPEPGAADGSDGPSRDTSKRSGGD